MEFHVPIIDHCPNFNHCLRIFRFLNQAHDLAALVVGAPMNHE